MMEPYERVKEVLNRLFGQTMQGLIYFHCARSLHRAFQESQIMTESYFFFGVYRAAMREATLALSRIMREHKDSITIYYLFNLIEDNAQLFSADDPEGLRQSVIDQKNQLEMHRVLIDSVSEQRNRVMAHLDRKHINAPADLFSHPDGVNLPELEKCLWEILDVLNFYAGYYGTGKFDVSDLESAITEEVDILLRWMRKYGRQEEWEKRALFDRFVIE
jgi:hypothetical protein